MIISRLSDFVKSEVLKGKVKVRKLKPERLESIKEAWKSGECDPDWIPELVEYIQDLQDGFKWIKDMENLFYNQVSYLEDGEEIRRIDPSLDKWANLFRSLLGTVNEALDPKYK